MQEIMTDKNQTSGYLAWVVCFTASLFFFYEFIQMNMFNAITGPLMAEFKLSATEVGRLSAAYFYSSVIFLFPAGTILDRVSTKKLILLALAICVIGTFLFAVSNSVLMMTICRFFTGIGSAFCFLSCVRLASRWFEAYRLALVIGLIVTVAMLGGLVAQTPLTLLTEHWGWRKALIFDVVVGLVIMMLIACLVKDYPKHYKKYYLQEMQHLSTLGYWKSMRLAFLKPGNWFCGIYTCLLNLPIYLLGGIWGILYLQQTQHISKTQGSIATSCLFFGTIIGSPLAGWFSDHFRLRRLPMILGAILSILVILAIMFTQNSSLLLICCLFFALGLVTATQIVSYPTVAESNPKPLTATSVSVVSITTLSGGAIFEPFFGWLMHMHWTGAMQNGVPVYSSADYQFAMWLFPIAFAVGLVAALLVRETHGHKKTFLS